MSNKELFIKSYLNKISERYKISNDEAFEIFSIATLLDLSFDEVYDDVIIRGKQDGGIDGIYFNEQDGYYVIDVFQCKNSKSLKQNQIEKLKNDFSEIFLKGNKDKPNIKDILPKLDKYISITKLGYRIEHRLHFVFNGEIDNIENPQNKELFKTFNSQSDSFFIYDSNEIDRRINTLIKADSKRKEVKFSFKAEKSNISPGDPQSIISYSIYNVKAVNFRLTAKALCQLIGKEIEINGDDTKLFSENIRGFLGFNKTNKKIRETLMGDDSIYFPFLNNGITILCDEMNIPRNTQAGEYIIPVVNPVIVNGLQSSKVIYEVYKKQESLLDNVYITIKLYETKDSELIEKITEATNTQSPINYYDKMSNKGFHSYTKAIFENNGIGYISKRGELFTNEYSRELKESVTSEKAIKFWYATYYEKPEIAKLSVSKILEEVFDATNDENPLAVFFNGKQDSPIYQQLFNSYLILKEVIRRKRELTEDFLNHSDELMSYGIYREICRTQAVFSTENIQKAYDTVYKYIYSLVAEEKRNLSSKGLTYSHNTYFKSAKCRIDYNKISDLTENDDLIRKLLNS